MEEAFNGGEEVCIKSAALTISPPAFISLSISDPFLFVPLKITHKPRQSRSCAPNARF
jgi:hypothetical protein